MRFYSRKVHSYGCKKNKIFSSIVPKVIQPLKIIFGQLETINNCSYDNDRMNSINS